MRNIPVFNRLPPSAKPAIAHPSGEGALSFTSNDGCTYTGGQFSFTSNDGVTIASFTSNDGCTFSSNDGVTIASFSSNDGVTVIPPLRFKATGNHYTTFRSNPSQANTIDYTWPTTLPPAGNGVLTTNASGTLSWAANSSPAGSIDFNGVTFDGSNATTSDRFFDNTTAVWSTQYYYGPGGTVNSPTLAPRRERGRPWRRRTHGAKRRLPNVRKAPHGVHRSVHRLALGRHRYTSCRGRQLPVQQHP